MRSAIDETLSLVIESLTRLYSNSDRYELALCTYALHIADTMSDLSTPELAAAKDQALQYLEALAVGGGTYSMNSRIKG